MELREKVARELCAEKGGIDPDAPQLGGRAKVWESFLPAADRILALPEIKEALASGGPSAAVIAMPDGYSAAFEDGVWHVRQDANAPPSTVAQPNR